MTTKLGLGVIGLGRAFTLMLPTFAAHPQISLVAASDPRLDALQRFAVDWNAATYGTAEALCADPNVQAVYVASPHQFHLEHVATAARAGKHILVEKPMALSISECEQMIDIARATGVFLLVGHSHSYDQQYLRTRELIQSGRFGKVCMIHAMNYTDCLPSAPMAQI